MCAENEGASWVEMVFVILLPIALFMALLTLFGTVNVMRYVASTEARKQSAARRGACLREFAGVSFEGLRDQLRAAFFPASWTLAALLVGYAFGIAALAWF
jgi:hypothetical protein